ncbi:hypothetical protein [Nannocystis pusilla]|uniref:hypothetical protein n=1 Tax=Nannocystis pusilla TaxID=889268 RepID=UPI003DA4BCFC
MVVVVVESSVVVVVVGLSTVVVEVVGSVDVGWSVVLVDVSVAEVLPSSPHAAPTRINEESKEVCRRESIPAFYHKPAAREISPGFARAPGNGCVGGFSGPAGARGRSASAVLGRPPPWIHERLAPKKGSRRRGTRGTAPVIEPAIADTSGRRPSRARADHLPPAQFSSAASAADLPDPHLPQAIGLRPSRVGAVAWLAAERATSPTPPTAPRDAGA